MRSNGINIRVSDIIYGVIKRRFLIVFLTVAGLLTGIVLSGISYLRGEMSREYLITSSFSVNTQTQTGLYTSGYEFPNYNDLNMAEELVDAVSYALKSDRMLNDIIDSLGLLGVTTTDIGDNLELSQYNETQIIEMSLYWRSSQEGIDILTEINRLAPEILKETLNIGSVSVINEPSARYVVGGRINMVLWGYMALLGLGLGFGITLLELIMRPTLINVQDVEDVFGLDILCEVAEDKAYFRPGKSMLVEEAGDKTGENFASAAHIILTQQGKKETPHIIYITSTIRGEGKTQMLANLAIRLSDLEKHVLLVDFDMKNPELGKLFLKNADYERSLNALYAGEITEKEAITALTGYLDILPTVPERSSIPLDSNLFTLIRKLASGYDYVLIDTAPVGLSADPMSLNQIASTAMFVIRYDMASLQEIRDALERIRKSGVSILGCLVNGVKVSERGIRNPLTEKADMRKAERRDESLAAPHISAEWESVYRAGWQGSGGEGRPLVAELSDAKEGGTAEDAAQEVTTGDSFIERLFEAQDNRTVPVEKPEADMEMDGSGTDIWESEAWKGRENIQPEENGYREAGKTDTGYVEKASDSIDRAQKHLTDLLDALERF